MNKHLLHFCIALVILPIFITMFTPSTLKAGEFKPFAQFMQQFEFSDAGTVYKKYNVSSTDQHFLPVSRIRIGFNYIQSENLSATYIMQLGGTGTGELYGTTSDNGSDFDSEWTVISVRELYIDYTFQNTDAHVRMGTQSFTMPSFAFGSAVFNTRASGIFFTLPINEHIKLGSAWFRSYSNDEASASLDYEANEFGGDDADIFALMSTFTYNGFRFAPWVMYAHIGNKAGEDGGFGAYGRNQYVDNKFLYGTTFDVAYIGASFELTHFAPFRFAIDAYYSNARLNPSSYSSNQYDKDINGFFVGAVASYTTDYGVPTIKGWYSSGDKDVTELYGYISPDRPNVDETTGKFGQPFDLVSLFGGTSIWGGMQMLDSGYSSYASNSPAGTWGVILEWDKISFMEKMSHTLRFGLIVGTNDIKDSAIQTVKTNLGYLGTGDIIYEIDFNTKYFIYKNFLLSVELGWLHGDYERYMEPGEGDDIYRVAFNFMYNF